VYLWAAFRLKTKARMTLSNHRIITLDEFILRTEKAHSASTGELSGLLRDIGVAAKIINREVNKAGLVNILGADGSENESGDTVQKLDVYANDRMIEFLRNSGECCGLASEELPDILQVEGIDGKSSKYVILFDPLDGSSNIDVNVSIGTIFSIFRRRSPLDGPCDLGDFLQKGVDQVAAGYVIYGTSTILVYTTGQGVNGFTLDPSIGEFCLSHRDIRMPARGKYYSVNQGYYRMFDPEIRRYIDACAERNLGLRYIGSMVSDIHRILFQGGIFLYPGTTKNPKGKLRLLYECNPMAFIVEQAGGRALTTDLERIMDQEAGELHQRATIVAGSMEMVDEMAEFLRQQRSASAV
jgi:fructose-1,6-bisphosphatase I